MPTDNEYLSRADALRTGGHAMSDVPTATKIAALEEQVRQLTADAAAFNSIMNRGQEWMNSAHDSWKRMCNQREEAREALTKALADNATLNTAKDRLIDERNACLRELDAARKELADRNAYAERLLAENVRLSNEAAFMRSFINNEDVRSDFQTVTQMRQALEASKAREEAFLADVVRLTAEREEWRKINENQSILVMLTEAELDRERERCGVLEREVKAWRHWNIEDAKVGGDDEVDANANAAWGLLECCQRETDTRHALDAAKFDQHKRGSIIECLDKVRDAGGHAWDNVANPDAVLRGDDDAAKFGKEQNDG